MKTWQYYALQANIMIACSLASTSPFAIGVFLFLAIVNMISMWFTHNHD